MMEYLLSNAAVARSLTSYAASAFGVLEANAWRVEIKNFAAPPGFTHLDFLAVAVVVVLTVCLCFRYEEQSRSFPGFLRVGKLQGAFFMSVASLC